VTQQNGTMMIAICRGHQEDRLRVVVDLRTIGERDQARIGPREVAQGRVRPR
jgi:hypothetical protein